MSNWLRQGTMPEIQSETGFFHKILDSLRTQFITWVVGIIIAILGLFSGQIVESIKFSLNKADYRSKYYEELAVDFSQYLFRSEILHEFLEENWTTKPTLTSIVKQYNDAIREIRKKEYVYLSWIDRYWEEEEGSRFAAMMELVRKFDKSVHTLNDEFEAINILESKEKMTDDTATSAAANLEPILTEMKTEVREMLGGFI